MKVKFKIFRFNPEKDKKSHYKDYTLEVKKGTTVLDILNEIKWYHDGSLTFRSSCRSAICGSCAVLINKKAGLACKAQVLENTGLNSEILIEPLKNLKVVKDLVVDMDPYWQQIDKIIPWVITDVPEPKKEYLMDREQVIGFKGVDDCITCGCCYSDCSVRAVDDVFRGPAALTRGYRFVVDPRDRAKKRRLKKLSEKHGIWECVRCYFCSEVCPKRVKHREARLHVRTIAFEEGLTNNAGARHAKAFLHDVKSRGKLNEFLLAFRTRRLGVIKMMPLALRMAFKGKIPFPLQKPIPNIKDVRRIYKLLRKKK